MFSEDKQNVFLFGKTAGNPDIIQVGVGTICTKYVSFQYGANREEQSYVSFWNYLFLSGITWAVGLLQFIFFQKLSGVILEPFQNEFQNIPKLHQSFPI